MIRNYLKIAWRNLVNQRVYSLLNLSGLSLGLTCVLIIALYLKNEVTFDGFHEKADRIYRLTNTTTNASGTEIKHRTGNTGAVQGPAFAASIPEIESVTRMMGVSFNVRQSNEGFFQNAHYVDSNFFQTFSLPLLEGTSRSALAGVNSVVLTEKGAEKYFGTAHALGQRLSLEINGKFEPFVVSGVASNPRPNSSLQFEMLLPFNNYKDDQWLSQYLATFFVLRPGVSTAKVEQKMAQTFAVLGREQVAKAAQERGYQEQRLFGLQPLTDIHLTVSYGGGNELASPNSPMVLYLLGGIAIFILTIACINFVNLTIARSLRRAREVGVRKVIGGKRSQLIKQFLGESFLLSTLAFGLALVLAQLILPYVNAVVGQTLSLSYLFDTRLVLLYVGLLVITALLAGSYPAFVLSKFNPSRVLYGRVGLPGKNYLSQGLVVVQFALSVILIVATLAVFAQFDFLTTKDLGYNPEHLVRIELPPQREGNDNFARLFRQKLASQPDVVSVTAKDRLDEYTSVRTTDKELDVNYLRIDDNYLPTLGIKLAQGRNFSTAYASDTLDNALVNESFVREAGWKNPIGQRVFFPDRTNKAYRVVGVVRDYHFSSLHEAIRPQVFIGDADLGFGEVWVRIRPGNSARTLTMLDHMYHEIVPQHYYHYQFMDTILAQQYDLETRLRQIISWAAGLCLFISCLGLFGIATFSAERRTKEIGVRKVLGASTAEVATLLSRDLLWLLLPAILIAIPIAWLSLNNWLEMYPFHVNLSAWLFVGAACFTVFIALATVSFQSVKAALMNPVKSLRTE
ncbi:ABC transporter permease [Spirosoma endbachense]|uniref:FtsX-like permease family protein n=1 Tax=Spirosoma endbachense TaxID=2666025 RepID=A0A6P1VPE3_9BACT|nr:ABC transporter permease [Spirosoma endbachense]QHV94494.1 FtsX-like permease family protein [Spirosoma endbachense]